MSGGGERSTGRLTGGWPLVGWSALAIATMVAGLLGHAGTGPDAIRVVIRATARTSVALFTLAFAAAALARRWPSRATHWLLANRRYVGVSFAVSHFAHLLAILALAGLSPGRPVAGAGVLVSGGIGYALLAAMTLTSFDRTAAWLGPQRWKRLHTAGAYYLWLVFSLSFVPRAVTEPVLYAPFAAALLAALVLRLWRGAPPARGLGTD